MVGVATVTHAAKNKPRRRRAATTNNHTPPSYDGDMVILPVLATVQGGQRAAARGSARLRAQQERVRAA